MFEYTTRSSAIFTVTTWLEKMPQNFHKLTISTAVQLRLNINYVVYPVHLLHLTKPFLFSLRFSDLAGSLRSKLLEDKACRLSYLLYQQDVKMDNCFVCRMDDIDIKLFPSLQR
jgi:hypothetical protein